MLVILPIVSLILVEEIFSQQHPKQEEFNYNFQQSDYDFQFERVEIVSYNKKYVKHFSVIGFRYNRTIKAINATFNFNIDLGTGLEIVAQTYKFMSNEYRYFPARVGVHFCKILSAKILGADEFLKCGNFTGCPLVKRRTYHVCNWIPNGMRMPPLIPNGRYMLEIQGLYNAEEVYVFRGYAEVSRPFFKK